jgi:hypothetical protein
MATHGRLLDVDAAPLQRGDDGGITDEYYRKRKF